ncbi:MAG: 50S ribosomal protein L10 [Patescibacteria group bacterium]|nr:50S ribosomal protein L10 [Patescibacteria group bacterium]
MAKTRVKKETEASRYAKALADAKSVVFADLSALKVADSTELRRKSRAERVTVVAAKKTLLKRALKDAGLADVTDVKALPGSVFMLLGEGDEVAPAKVLETFRKTNEKVAVLGGLLEAKWMSGTQVKALASLPSKEQLLGQLLGTLNAPINGFVRVLDGVPTGLVRVLNGIKDAKAA